MGLIRKLDPADVLLFGGLAAVTAAGVIVHVALGLAVLGVGAIALGLMAGRTPKDKQ